MKVKKAIKSCLAVVAVVALSLGVQSFTTPTTTENSASSTTFVKTNARCSKCRGCSGYWGYKHGNGTFEGACSNSDGWGHTCGHGPEKHGLRKWWVYPILNL